MTPNQRKADLDATAIERASFSASDEGVIEHTPGNIFKTLKSYSFDELLAEIQTRDGFAERFEAVRVPPATEQKALYAVNAAIVAQQAAESGVPEIDADRINGSPREVVEWAEKQKQEVTDAEQEQSNG